MRRSDRFSWLEQRLSGLAPLPVFRVVATDVKANRWFSIAMALMVAIVIFAPVFDPDVWWIAAAGRDMMRLGAVPRSNAYGFLQPDFPWVMHEWALGPIFAWGAAHFDARFFSVWAALTMLLGGSVFYRHVQQRILPPVVRFVWWFITIKCCGERFISARPAGLSLLLAAAVVTLTFDRPFSRARSLLAVSLVLLWTQLHGSFPLGVALLALAVITETDRRGERALVAAAAAALTLVNPYGWKLHALVIDYALARQEPFRSIRQNIVDFRPIWSSHVSAFSWLACACFAFLVLFVAAHGSNRERIRALFCAGLAVQAVLHQRELYTFVAVSSMLLAASFCRTVERPRALPQAIIFPAIAALLLSFSIRLFVHRDRDAWVGDVSVGPGLTQVLRAIPPHSRVFTVFLASGMALWELTPHATGVFYDARNDCYPAWVMRDFASLTTAKPDTLAILSRTHTDWLVVENDDRLRLLLTKAPSFERKQVSKRWELWARRADVPSP